MGVDAVDDVVAVGVALDHEVAGFVAIEAVPHVRELGADNPAGGLVALDDLGHVGRVLGNTHPVRLTVGVAETRHFGVDDVGLGAAPGQQERAKFLGIAKGRGAIGFFAPAGDLGVTHEQLAVVDQKRTRFLGQAQLLGAVVDFQNALVPDHNRQARQVHTRCGLAEVLLGHACGKILEVHVAVVDENRLRNAALAHHPLGHFVVAADEVFQRVFLHHAAHADFTGGAAHDFGRSRFGGVTREVGQCRFRDIQRCDGRGADGVGFGVLQLFGHGRFDRLDSGKRSGTGQQQSAGQQADRADISRMIHVTHSRWRCHQKRQITSTNARCMYESTPLPYASPGLNTPPRKRTSAEGSSMDWLNAAGNRPCLKYLVTTRSIS